MAKFVSDIGKVHHVATASLGLRNVGEICNKFPPKATTFNEVFERITDDGWQAATDALLSIERGIEEGKKLIQEFFRKVTDSTVDFYDS